MFVRRAEVQSPLHSGAMPLSSWLAWAQPSPLSSMQPAFCLADSPA